MTMPGMPGMPGNGPKSPHGSRDIRLFYSINWGNEGQGTGRLSRARFGRSKGY